MERVGRVGLILFVIAVVGACGIVPESTPRVRALGPGERWLPAANWTLPGGGRILCAGGGRVGASWSVHGSPDDVRLAWQLGPDGQRTELAFAPGWSARFTPRLEILDDSGNVVAREGSAITGGCRTAEPGVELPEF